MINKDLMKNNYGNYVVQKALKLAGEENKRRIIELIIRNLEKLNEKKLVLKWRFIIQNYLQSVGQGNEYNLGLVSFDQINYQFISQRNISDHYWSLSISNTLLGIEYVELLYIKDLVEVRFSFNLTD